jgi:hypothetical protein
MEYRNTDNPERKYDVDSTRLEAVTTCVGFDDFLDETLASNHHHFDNFIVVTSHHDRKTQAVAQKHGATCVQTDLFKKNGRVFNKGAAINAGFGRFQFFGWRMHLDADIIVPDNFRRILFNHSFLERYNIYGADRINIIGYKNFQNYHYAIRAKPQAADGYFVESCHAQPIGARYVDPLLGYCPLGFFQLWHSSQQKPYPYSIGDASHDDILFAQSWPQANRIHLPTIICHQLCQTDPKMAENWEGRRHARFNKE